MKNPFFNLPTSAAALLTDFRVRLKRRARILVTLFTSCVFLLALVGLAIFARWTPGPEFLLRWGSFVLLCGLTLVGAILATRRFFPETSDHLRLAHRLEKLLGSGHEHFASGIQLLGEESRGKNDGFMLRQLEREAGILATNQQFRLPPSREIRFLSIVFLSIAAIQIGLLALPSLQYSLMAGRVLMPWAPLPKPAFTQIHIGDVPGVFPRGDDLAVSVRLSGSIPERAFIAFGHMDSPETWTKVPLQRTAKDSFLHFFLAVPEDFSFQVQAGDNKSEVYSIRVADRAKVIDTAATILWPEYTALPEQALTAEETREIRVSKGSSLRLHFTMESHAPESVKVAIQKENLEETSMVPEKMQDGSYQIKLENLEESLSWRIDAKSPEGFENLEHESSRVVVLDDARPTLRLIAPEAVMRIYPSESVTLLLEGEDDYGIRSVDLAWKKNPDPDTPRAPERIPLWSDESNPAGERTLSLEREIRPSEFSAVAGDKVEIFVEAIDSLDQFSRSQSVFLEIVAFDPGREERVRIANLRVMRSAIGLLRQVPVHDRGIFAWKIPSEAENSFAVEWQALGVAEWQSPAKAEELIDRIAEEILLTNYPLYREDLRNFCILLGGVLLSGGANDDPVLDSLDRYLENAVNFRSALNLVNSLDVLSSELTLLASQEQLRGLDDFRSTVSDWFSEAATIFANLSVPAPPGEESWGTFAQNASARLFALRAGQPATFARVEEVFQTLRTAAVGILPYLSAAVLESRSGLQIPPEFWDRFERASSDETRVHSARLLEKIFRMQANDPSCSPALSVGVFSLLLALETPDPYGRNLAAALRYLSSPPATVAASVNALLVDGLKSYYLRLATPQGGGFSPENLSFQSSALASQEAARGLNLASQDNPPRFNFSSLPSFVSDLSSIFAALQKDFVESGTRWSQKIDDIEKQLANFVPSTTRQMRGELLAEQDAFFSSSRMLADFLRVFLQNGWVPPEAAGFSREELSTLLVAISFRRENFLALAEEPLRIFSAARNEELSNIELDLFTTRINTYKGAAAAFLRISSALQSGGETASTLLSQEAERLALLSRIGSLLQLMDTPAADRNFSPEVTERTSAMQTVISVLGKTPEDAQETEEFLRLFQEAVSVISAQDPASVSLDPPTADTAVLYAKAELLRASLNLEASASAVGDGDAGGNLLLSSYARLLAPAAAADPETLFRGVQGVDFTSQQIWIVRELVEIERMPPPSRFPSAFKEYYQQLKRSFRQHPHTR